MTTLVSFDVDGTLIVSKGDDANKLHKLAFAAGMKQVFDVDTNIDVIKHHGSTDPLILVAVLGHHGVPYDKAMAKLKDMEAAMNDFFLEAAAADPNTAAAGLEVLPGVLELLETLQKREDVVTCLVTGNLEPIAWGKMRALGLESLFTQPPFGGFGSDFCSGNHQESWKDRMELVSIAADRAEKLRPEGITSRFHVGDTPMDLQAADGAGAKGVGVTTGIYSQDDLAAASPNSVVLAGLDDVPQVLEALGLDW